MSQTNLKSDDLCGYNQSAAPFFWVMEPKQYFNTYVFGEVGVSAAGGTAGSYVRPEIIDVSSFLSGRDNILTKCQPPVPDLDSLKPEPITKQKEDTVNLLPKYTREKKSAIDLSSIDYNRWIPQDINPQDLRFIIEDFWAQRGGLDTQNYSKLAWDTKLCETILDPSRTCGKECENINGYPGRDWITGQKKSASYKESPKPPHEPGYPFKGPYSQQAFEAGIKSPGPNYYYGPNFNQGMLPSVNLSVLGNNGELKN